MKRLLLMMGIGTFTINAQNNNTLEGSIDPCAKFQNIDRRVIPYNHLREADVLWSKRVWRVLDLREKMNLQFYYPIEPYCSNRSLIWVLRTYTIEGTITAYSALDDEFRLPLTIAEVESIGASRDTIMIEDPMTGSMVPTPIQNLFDPSTVKRIRLKEDYFFDRQKSQLDVRTIGICPVRESYDENGEYRGDSPMFWVYYPECRPVFAKSDVFNRNNGAEYSSLEDAFWRRNWSSYIYKESNVYDRLISEYKSGLDALLEGKKIHEEIRDWEQDLWRY